MVAVPVRRAPLLAAIASCTVPLPVPEAPEAIVSQSALDTAVHWQALDVVIVTVALPPDAGTVVDGGAIEKLHGGGAAAVCITVNAWPPIASVPARAAPAFEATLNDRVPAPVPDAPEAIVIHGTFDTAVHAQPWPAATEIEPPPPLAAIDWLVGAIEKEHGADAWLIENV